MDRQPRADAGGQRCRIRRGDRDRPQRDQGAHRRLPERPGRRETPFRCSRREDRRGLHRQLYDQHRPLPRRRQGSGGRRQFGPDPPLDRTADQNGRTPAHRGGLLQHLRQGRCPYRDAGLLAVHGQPGPCGRRCAGLLHLHPQLPQPPGQGRDGLPRLRRTGRCGGTAGQDPERGGVHGEGRHAQYYGR